MSEAEISVNHEEAVPPRADMMLHASQSMSALWYVAATNFGAQAVNRLASGGELHSPRAFAGFAGEIVLSAFAASKGISNLEDYLASKRTKRTERATALAPVQ